MDEDQIMRVERELVTADDAAASAIAFAAIVRLGALRAGSTTMLGMAENSFGTEAARYFEIGSRYVAETLPKWFERHDIDDGEIVHGNRLAETLHALVIFGTGQDGDNLHAVAVPGTQITIGQIVEGMLAVHSQRRAKQGEDD